MGNLKKKTGNAVVWVILLLLILGLGGFGVSNFGGGNTAVITVGDTEVDVNEYSRAMQQELRSISAQTGQNIPLSQALAFGLDQGVRARLVTEAALDNETARIGLSVGDERVKTEVLSISAFHGVDGKFDRTTYKQSLNRAGLNEAEFENSVRVETARTLLQSAIIDGVAAPTAMTKAFLDYAQERRNFKWVRLDQSNLAQAIPEPSDEDLQSYYQANEAAFTEPQKKHLDYIWVTPDMIVDQIEISEEDLQKEYDSRKGEYSSPETRLVERLVFPSDKDAAAAKALLDSGEASFEDLVKQRGLALLDIDLGNVTLGDLGDAGKVIFTMQAPGITDVLATDLGPALFRMNGIIAARETSLDDVRDDLQAELALDKAHRQINASINDIDDLLAGGANLKEIAAETDLRLASIDWAVGDSEGIASYNAFREAAETVNQGDYAEILELDDGGIFAIEFTKVIDPALNPIDQVMASVIAGWEKQEVEKALAALTTELLDKISEGTDVSELGYEAIIETDILRSDTIPDAPAGFIETVFSMDKGQSNSVSGDSVVYLVQLDDILPPDPNNPDLELIRAQVQDGVSQSLAQDISAAFSGVLQSQAGVQINSAAVNAVHAQMPQ